MPMMIHWMLAALLLSAPAPVTACEDAAVCRCVPFTTAEATERADAVFLATVVGVRDIAPEDARGPGHEREVRLRLEAAWKGLDSSATEVTVVARGTSCDIHFEAGERYVVYGRAEGGAFATGMCSGTRMLDPGAEALEGLGKPQVSWPEADPAPRG
jgi:hypothetical protein